MTYKEVRAAVFAAAEESEPPTWLVLRQAEIESNFNPAAVSDLASDQALGVLQIRPSTGAKPGFGVAPISAEDLTDPYKNVLFGCRYLAGIRLHFKGGWGQAFLRYNVGPGGILTNASAAYKVLALCSIQTYNEFNPLS